MKNFKIISSFLLFLCFIGCTTDYRTDDTGLKMTPPAINALSKTEWQLTKPAIHENPLVFRLSWSKTRFNYDNGNYILAGDVKYEVQLDLTANNFEKAKIIAKTSELYTDVFTVDLKALIDELKGEEIITPQNISVRIKSISQKGESFSEPLNLTISTYFNIDPAVKNIFIIGDMNGWDNKSKDYIAFRNSNNYDDGSYTYTGYFPKETYFKFCAEEYLGSYLNLYCAGAGGKLEFGDLGAFYVGKGYHTINIDIKKNTWEILDPAITSPKIYNELGPIGGFCNWDNEPLMTKSSFDPHQWKITYDFTSSSALKFRGNKDWGNNWGGTDKDIPYGKGVFDGPGATVQTTGKYDIYFNDLSNNYAIIKQK